MAFFCSEGECIWSFISKSNVTYGLFIEVCYATIFWSLMFDEKSVVNCTKLLIQVMRGFILFLCLFCLTLPRFSPLFWLLAFFIIRDLF